jgi:hypothetical protein
MQNKVKGKRKTSKQPVSIILLVESCWESQTT